ncbi:MAG: FAD:protein FMN transferase [Gemmatales bacterium]|nr:FAD:protein FMN transferase [Gemmatales bacterium]MDW8386956.1 FAD:protein FMN transferase [Gemmatales bacterium]
MDRRRFLNPEPLLFGADIAASLFSDPLAETLDDGEGPALVRYSRRAMGTTFEIVLPLGTPRASEAACAALDLIDHLESLLTVYRDHSELSRVNREAFDHEVAVSAELFEILALSSRLTHETGGAFDVASGAIIKAWGFLRGPRRVPAPEEQAEAIQRSGMRFVVLHPERRTVRFLRDGVEINLGSIGKGYALDQAAALLRERFGIQSALLHGGHSSVYAIGSLPGHERGWPVGVTHPEDPSVRLLSLWLRDSALGVSAKTFRHLEWQGRKLGHILDPRTGWPAEGLAHVSVLAPTAAEADALATALFVLGEAEARRYLASRPDLQAIILSEAQREELARPR